MVNKTLKNLDRYYRLDAPKEFWNDLKETPYKVKECCNGVGSTVGFLGKITYHLIPNRIYGLDVTEASDIHDYMCTYPKYFKTKQDAVNWKRMADNMLLDNVIIIIERDTRWQWLKNLRRYRAMSFYNAVDSFGDESFFDDKIIGEK